MAYSAGLLNHRITIAYRLEALDGDFGRNSGGVRYSKLGEFWAGVTFTKGMRAIHEGAVDAYETLMIRMRWNPDVNRDSLIAYDDRIFCVQSLNRDFHENIIQIVAVEKPDIPNAFYEVLMLAAQGTVLTADGQILSVVNPPQENAG